MRFLDWKQDKKQELVETEERRYSIHNHTHSKQKMAMAWCISATSAVWHCQVVYVSEFHSGKLVLGYWGW